MTPLSVQLGFGTPNASIGWPRNLAFDVFLLDW
jgi:hypothetical protein